MVVIVFTLCNSGVFSQDEAAPEKTTDQSYFDTLNGYSVLRYRGQKQEDNKSDQDMFQYLNLSLGEAQKDRFTWYFFGSLTQDVDGSNANTITKEKFKRLIFSRTPVEENPEVSASPFFSIDDSIEDDFIVRPYEFYTDVNDVPLFKNIRAGRQYIREVENLHFDGIKLEFADFAGVRFTSFTGVPVHFFETSDSGDFIAGASAEFQPINKTRLKLDYSFVNDNNSDIGGNDDNFFALSLRHNIKDWWNIFADFSMVGQTGRDAELRSNWVFPVLDLDFNISIFKQLSILEDFTIEFDDFNYITGDYFPYTQYSVNIYKGIWDHFGIGMGLNLRELNETSNEGDFNHEFENYYVTASSSDFPLKGMSISVSSDLYYTDDDETRVLGFDVSQKIGEKLKIGAGSHYSLFKFDHLAESERDNARTYFLNAKYKLTEKIGFDMDYEFERSNQESFHTVETALKYSF